MIGVMISRPLAGVPLALRSAQRGALFLGALSLFLMVQLGPAWDRKRGSISVRVVVDTCGRGGRVRARGPDDEWRRQRGHTVSTAAAAAPLGQRLQPPAHSQYRRKTLAESERERKRARKASQTKNIVPGVY